MSKSYGNEIPFAANAKELQERVRLMVTDPNRIRKTDRGNPDICTVYTFHKIFTADECPEIAQNCQTAQIGCVACKDKLASRMADTLSSVRERRAAFLSEPEKVKEILACGAQRAGEIARATMQEVRQAMNLL